MVYYYPFDSLHDPVLHFTFGTLSEHPEKPRRSSCLLKSVRNLPNTSVTECHREATMEELLQVHSTELIGFVNDSWSSLFKISKKENSEVILDVVPSLCRDVAFRPVAMYHQVGYFCFDVSTPIGKETARVSRISAATAIDAASQLTSYLKASTEAPIIYAMCRPPGHHATRTHYGGYCYFNNAALAANILTKYGPVAILDVDYHHGNGTQSIFYDRSDVYYISIHGNPEFEYPYYSGAEDEIGVGEGKNFNRNFPLPPGTSWDTYKPSFDQAINLISNFNPTTLVISLGLDAADGDPICTFHLKPGDYREMGNALRNLNKPILVVQEGGYSENEMLGACTESFFQGLRRL